MKTPTEPLQSGDVVQISPAVTMFAGCFMVVTEPKSFGAVGYITGVGNREDMPSVYPFRASFAEFELIGRAVFVRYEG